MTNTNINTTELVTEFHALTTQNLMNTYRKGEIISLLSGAPEFGIQEVGKLLGIAKTQTYDLLNIFNFTSDIPMIDPVEVLSKVGTQNIRWLSTKSRQALKEEIQMMVNDECTKDSIQSRISEMKEQTKTERPVKVDPRDEMIAVMSQHIRELWLEKLGDTLPVAIQELIGEEEEEARQLEVRKHIHPTSKSKTGRELQQRLIDEGYAKAAPVEEEEVEEPIPQDIIDEVLSTPDEEVSEEEDMQLEFVEVETEPSITESQYDKAKTLVNLGIGSEVDIATVDEYEKEHQVGKYSPDMKSRLSRVGIHRNVESTPAQSPRKVFVGYESEDDAFSSEAMGWE